MDTGPDRGRTLDKSPRTTAEAKNPTRGRYAGSYIRQGEHHGHRQTLTNLCPRLSTNPRTCHPSSTPTAPGQGDPPRHATLELDDLDLRELRANPQDTGDAAYHNWLTSSTLQEEQPHNGESEEDVSQDPKEPHIKDYPNSGQQAGYQVSKMALPLQTKLDLLKNDILVKTQTITSFLMKTPDTLPTKRHSILHLEHICFMLQDFADMVTTYISVLPEDVREAEQPRLSTLMANFEASIRNPDEQYHDLVRGEGDHHAPQYPPGCPRYSSLAAKVVKEQKELWKLIDDMGREGRNNPDPRRLQLYADSTARHRGILDKEIPALAQLIMDTHDALTTEDLDDLHGFGNILWPLIQEATRTFTRLTHAVSTSHPTLTPNISLIRGARFAPHTTAPMAQHLLPGSINPSTTRSTVTEAVLDLEPPDDPGKTEGSQLIDNAELKAKQEEYGLCPACSKGHTLKDKSGATVASSRMTDSPIFNAMEPDARVHLLSWLHKQHKP